MRIGADNMNVAGSSWSRLDTMTTGRITNLAVGTNFIYVIGSMGGIFRHSIDRSGNVGKVNWHKLPGSASRIAVSALGKVFCVNSSDMIYHLGANDSWIKVNGSLCDIAVSRSEVVGCNREGRIYSWTLDHTGAPDSMGAWVVRPGGLARIHTNEHGAIWGVNSGDKIFALESTASPPPYSQPAAPMPAPMPAPAPNPNHWNDWTAVSGALVQCSVGTKQVWGVNQSQNIYVRPLDTMSRWQKVDGAATEVEVGPQGAVYAVNAGGDVFMRLGANNRHISGDRWSKIDSRTPGRVTSLAVGPNHIYVIGTGERIYRHAINHSGDVGNRVRWHNVNGAARRVAIGPTGKVFCVNNQDKIFHLGRDDRWQPVSGALTDIAVTKTEVVGCNQRGEIYSWALDHHNCPDPNAKWHKRNGNLSRLGANTSGHIWGIDRGQKIFATESSGPRHHGGGGHGHKVGHSHPPAHSHVVHHPPPASSSGGMGMVGAAIGGALLGGLAVGAMKPKVVHKPAPRPVVIHKPAPIVIHKPAPRPVVIHKPAPRPVVIHKPAPRPVHVIHHGHGGGMGMGGGMGGGRHHGGMGGGPGGRNRSPPRRGGPGGRHGGRRR